MRNHLDNPFQYTKSVILLPMLFVLSLWLVFWYELNFNHNLSHFGIYPRETYGLKGILFSPFLHGDLEHLSNNSIALFILKGGPLGRVILCLTSNQKQRSH